MEVQEGWGEKNQFLMLQNENLSAQCYVSKKENKKERKGNEKKKLRIILRFQKTKINNSLLVHTAHCEAWGREGVHIVMRLNILVGGDGERGTCESMKSS